MISDMDDETLRIFAYVNISSYRADVVKALADGKMDMPSGIAREMGIKTNNISKVLKELKATEVVECINEEARKGRLYRLTALGEEIARHLD